jgi:hypothetical protein
MRNALAVVAVSLLLAPHAFAATAQRTFVSSAGADSAACSLATPCRSFGAAIAATNPAGEIIVLDAAGYGAVTVAKSISIIAAPGLYAGISVLSGNGVTINAPSATVVLRGLAINGQGGGSGIELQDAARVRIENCQVANMSLYGIVVTGGAELTVTDTTLRENAGAGIRVSPAATDVSVLLERVRSEHNGSQGLYAVPGVSGATVHAAVSVADSTFAYNGADGIYIGNASNGDVQLDLKRSTLTGNVGNGVQVENASSNAATVASFTENDISGNVGRGILGTESGSGASIHVAVGRNSINHNGSDGVRLSRGPGPGFVDLKATLAGNVISDNQGDGIELENAIVTAVANVIQRNATGDVRCATGPGFSTSDVDTLGNNVAGSIAGCAIGSITGL